MARWDWKASTAAQLLSSKHTNLGAASFPIIRPADQLDVSHQPGASYYSQDTCDVSFFPLGLAAEPSSKESWHDGPMLACVSVRVPDSTPHVSDSGGQSSC